MPRCVDFCKFRGTVDSVDTRLEQLVTDGDFEAFHRLTRAARRHGLLVPEMTAIPVGKGFLGSPLGDPARSDDEAQTRVTFWIGTAAITEAEWESVMGSRRSPFRDPGMPLESVSWYDAVEYCNALSAVLGLPNSYRVDGKGVRWVRGPGFRLPTEVEWEYAARAGSEGPRYGNPDEFVWHAGNSGCEAHPTKLKRPNAWGLFDTLGNVWEWCWDAYGSRRSVAMFNVGGTDLGFRVARNRVSVSLQHYIRAEYWCTGLGFRVASGG